jgi:BASS family bile acid:Na+ symporter
VKNQWLTFADRLPWLATVALARTQCCLRRTELVKPGLTRTAAILAAIALGALLPQAHTAAWLIRWLVIGMLFVVFLQTHFSRESLHRSHALLLAANLAIAAAAWVIGFLVGGRDVALAAFFCGITPTATAAPVITSFLGGRVSYVVAAFLLSNVVIAALFPVVLPFVLGHPTPDAFAQVTRSVGVLVFAPLALAWLIRRIHPAAALWPQRLGNVTFSAWVTAIFLITAHASEFLRHQTDLSPTVLFEVAAVSLLVCVTNFTFGRLIGGREFPREASQSLGQKNTTFTIYLAMTYANPLVALGPTFYVLWHNLWNSWQLHRHQKT